MQQELIKIVQKIGNCKISDCRDCKIWSNEILKLIENRIPEPKWLFPDAKVAFGKPIKR